MNVDAREVVIDRLLADRCIGMGQAAEFVRVVLKRVGGTR